MIVVLDTSCISAFIRTNKVELLLEILDKHSVVITEQVQMELKLSKINLLRNFEHKKIEIKKARSELSGHNIHIGEASVILFAKENSALAVIDDKKARTAAEEENIEYIGTATLLKLAISKAIITRKEMEKIIEEITITGKLFLSQEIKNWIVE